MFHLAITSLLPYASHLGFHKFWKHYHKVRTVKTVSYLPTCIFNSAQQHLVSLLLPTKQTKHTKQTKELDKLGKQCSCVSWYVEFPTALTVLQIMFKLRSLWREVPWCATSEFAASQYLTKPSITNLSTTFRLPFSLSFSTSTNLIFPLIPFTVIVTYLFSNISFSVSRTNGDHSTFFIAEKQKSSQVC